MSELLNNRAAIARQIMDDLAEPWPMPIPMDEFNDDDVYVYNVASKELVGTLGCKSPELFELAYGFRVHEGQSWARGMTAKTLGLWRAV